MIFIYHWNAMLLVLDVSDSPNPWTENSHWCD